MKYNESTEHKKALIKKKEKAPELSMFVLSSCMSVIEWVTQSISDTLT